MAKTQGVKVYECRNPACVMGSRKDPGRFTGGISPEQAFALSGEPDAPSGDGYCPNCGDPATPAPEG